MMHIGDKGTVIIITIKQDGVPITIASATVKEIYLKPPTGAVLTKTASFYTDGSDGKLSYTLAGTELTVAGEWTLQAHITTPSGEWKTRQVKFTVEANLA